MGEDQGHSVARCKSGLSASEALAVTSGEQRYWERRARYWREQLAYARKREAEEKTS